MELWDALDENGVLTNKQLIRGDKFPKGLFHLVVDVLVLHEDGSVLVMQRDHNKETSPGIYEATASGSVLKGETSKEGALRELQEETGLTSDKLYFISRHVNKNKNNFYDQYICFVKCKKDSVVLQEGETISYKWLSWDEFLRFIETDKYEKPHKERLLKNMIEINALIDKLL